MNNEDIYNCIRKTDLIVSNTKEAYIQRLKRISLVLKADLADILLKPNEYIPILKEKHPKGATFKNYITPILAMVRYCPALKKYDDEQKIWKEALDDASAVIEDGIMKGNITDRQLEGYIPFSEFAKKRIALPEGSIERLLISMFSLIPPMRADFNRVKIYYDTIPTTHEPNNLLIQKKGKITNIQMTIGSYKTAKQYGKIVEMLPKELVKEIMKSLELYPRDWLFQNKKGEPYSPASFSKWVLMKFKHIYGKPLNIQILRHSFVSALDFNNLTMEQRGEIAKSMGHSVGQADRYKWTRINELLAEKNKVSP